MTQETAVQNLKSAAQRLLAFADERGIDLGPAGARVRNALTECAARQQEFATTHGQAIQYLEPAKRHKQASRL